MLSEKWPSGRFSSRPFSLPSAGRLSGRVLPLHHHRHRTHVGITAVLGMDVLQHCMSRQRSRVPNASGKVLDAICVRAGKTDQRHAVTVFLNAVHK
jgi:hypothetical protein